jgi:lipopolysaccharide transport system permease protein
MIMSHFIRQLSFKKELTWAWTYRILRGRYQQSILGGLWAILQPVASVFIFSIIFTIFIPINTGDIPYVVFTYASIVPWTLFSSSLVDMVESLVSNMNIVSKIYFPRETLPVSALLARLVDFLIAFSLLPLLMVFYQLPIYLSNWLFLPVILLTQLCLALGLGLIGAALNVFYRDIKHLITLGLQIWFFATPIIYPVSSVPERFRSLYFINPMAGVIESYRSILLYHELPGNYLFVSMGMAFVLLLFGYWFFKKVEFQFADVV